MPARGPAALRQRLQRPGAEPRRQHALRRQRHQQLRRRRPSRRAGTRRTGRWKRREDLCRPDPDRLVSRGRARLADGKKLFVANVKGHGSLSQPRAQEKGKNSHDHLGSVSIIDVPDDDQLAGYTKKVNANNRLAYSLAGLEKPRPDVKPVPVPARHGEPSVFKHVIYVIKENRTYDQVFGDMKEGNGDPNLVIFGEEVTPNQHALARQFTLFDNFYCSGVLSARRPPVGQRGLRHRLPGEVFGGFTRSYPYEGSDPLAFAPSGFLWDNALLHKKTFRNFGEFVKSTYAPKKATWTDLYDDYATRPAR